MSLQPTPIEPVPEETVRVALAAFASGDPGAPSDGPSSCIGSDNCPNDCRQKTKGRPNSRYCCVGDLPKRGGVVLRADGFAVSAAEFAYPTPNATTAYSARAPKPARPGAARAAAIHAQAKAAMRASISV